jgi:hypothetical protein
MIDAVVLLDLGNFLFVLFSFPQLISTYKNRTDLKAISVLTLLGYILVSSIFMLSGFLFGAWITIIVNVFLEINYLLQLYLKIWSR